LISSRPLAWAPGFHALANTAPEVPLDPDLLLIHLRLMDLDLALRKQRQYRGLDWSGRELERNWASHQRISDDKLRAYFDDVLDGQFGGDDDARPSNWSERTEIPPRFRDLF
jgi:hypothetical protein